MKTISLKIAREESWSLRDFVWLLALIQWESSLQKRFSLLIVWEEVLKFVRLSLNGSIL